MSNSVTQADRRLLILRISALMLVGLALASGVPAFTLTIFAATYVLLVVASVRATREREHGTASAVTAFLLGVIAVLMVPLTWGLSLSLAFFALPLGLPGLVARGAARWLAVLAMSINALAAATFAFALIWLA
jgi:hypothetical protein